MFFFFQPHLHEIVNRSMELACTSKEPYNYFLLLRALFRSIGGGTVIQSLQQIQLSWFPLHLILLYQDNNNNNIL